MTFLSGLCRCAIGLIAVTNWVFGSVLLVHVIWTLNTASNFHLITSGKSFIITSQLIFGLLISIKGLLGIFGVCGRQDWLLKLFMFLTVLTISIEVGTSISLKVADVQVSDFVEQSWTEANLNTRNYVQRKLKCCGLTGLSEFASKLDPIDASCYVEDSFNKEPYRVGCKDKLIDWAAKRKKSFLILLGALLIFQIVSVVLVLIKLRRRPNNNNTRDQAFKEEMLLEHRPME